MFLISYFVLRRRRWPPLPLYMSSVCAPPNLSYHLHLGHKVSNNTESCHPQRLGGMICQCIGRHWWYSGLHSQKVCAYVRIGLGLLH